MKSFQITEDSNLKFLNSSYRNVIQIIDFILQQRKRNDQKNHINILYYIKSLNELNTYENFIHKFDETPQIQTEDDQSDLISELINFIIGNNQNYNQKYYKSFTNIEQNESLDYSNESKVLFSCIMKYNQLFPIQSNLLDSIEKDDFQNEIKSKILQFRNLVSNYISISKSKIDSNETNKFNKLKKKKEMNDNLNAAYQSINVILIYFIHFLMTIKSPSKEESILLIHKFSKIQIVFIKLVAFLNTFNSSQSEDEHLYDKATKKLNNLVLKINNTSNLVFQEKEQSNETKSDEVFTKENEIEEIKNTINIYTSDEQFIEEEEEVDSCYDNDEDIDDEKLDSNEKINQNEKINSNNFKSDLFTILMDIMFNISKLNEFASFSFISEMYENEHVKPLRNKSVENLNDDLLKLKEEMNHNEMSDLYEKIELSLKKFIENSNSIEFNRDSEYIKHLIQIPSKKTKKKKKAKLTIKQKLNNKDGDETDQEYDDICDDDSEYANLNKLSPLISPQHKIYNTILSILNEISKNHTHKSDESKLNSDSMKISSNHFPSKPNLLKSYFLSADVEPYIGFRSQDNLNINHTSITDQDIVHNELANDLLFEKHIKRYGIAMKMANNSFDSLNKTLSEFNNVTGDRNATKGELIFVTNKLKEAIDDYPENALQISYFTKRDKTLQVEQLIGLHKYMDTVNELYETAQQRIIKGNEMINDINFAISNHQKALDLTVDQFRRYNKKYFEEGGKAEESKDKEEDELNKALDQEYSVLMKLNLYHDHIKQMLNDVNIMIKEENESNMNTNDTNKSLGPIMLSITNILKRAKELTRNRIINAKRDELRRNPIVIDSKGNIIRRTSINDINIKLENKEGLIKAAQDLYDASKVMLVCIESEKNHSPIQTTYDAYNKSSTFNFKFVSSLNSVKRSITSLITQILFIGGDRELIMNKEVDELNSLIGQISKKIEKDCNEKISQDFLNKNYLFIKPGNDSDVTKRVTPMINSLNLNYEIKFLRTDLESKTKELQKYTKENQ